MLTCSHSLNNVAFDEIFVRNQTLDWLLIS
jgi:hypothetical protein